MGPHEGHHEGWLLLTNPRVLEKEGIVICGAVDSYDWLKEEKIFCILNCQCKEKAEEVMKNSSTAMQDLTLMANPNFIQQKKWFQASVFPACTHCQF